MASIFKRFLPVGFALAVILTASVAHAQITERSMGNANAPIKVDEFVSLTCSHCAEFYTTILPTIEKNYIDAGKVRFVIHDYPLDGVSLKAAAIARCMPEDEFVPFIKTLYQTQANWAFGGGNPEDKLVQMAKLGGLPEDKARACANDTKLQDAIVAERTEANDKYKVQATPTFIINDGVQTIQGAQSAETFSAAFDKLLAAKK